MKSKEPPREARYQRKLPGSLGGKPRTRIASPHQSWSEWSEIWTGGSPSAVLAAVADDEDDDDDEDAEEDSGEMRGEKKGWSRAPEEEELDGECSRCNFGCCGCC